MIESEDDSLEEKSEEDFLITHGQTQRQRAKLQRKYLFFQEFKTNTEILFQSSDSISAQVILYVKVYLLFPTPGSLFFNHLCCLTLLFLITGSRTKLVAESPSRTPFRDGGGMDMGKTKSKSSENMSKPVPKSPKGENGKQKQCPVKGCDSQG